MARMGPFVRRKSEVVGFVKSENLFVFFFFFFFFFFLSFGGFFRWDLVIDRVFCWIGMNRMLSVFIMDEEEALWYGSPPIFSCGLNMRCLGASDGGVCSEI